MNTWNPDIYIKAWNYASKAHNGQLVPSSDIPYINHIGLVAMEAMAVIANGGVENPDLLIQCALLHDTIEDTEITYSDIKNEFGVAVADGVLALTKNSELPKPKRMLDSLARIKLQPVEISMVKLADRITNLQPPPKHWEKSKILNYRDEARLILEKSGEACSFLAERLGVKIAEYEQWI